MVALEQAYIDEQTRRFPNNWGRGFKQKYDDAKSSTDHDFDFYKSENDHNTSGGYCKCRYLKPDSPELKMFATTYKVRDRPAASRCTLIDIVLPQSLHPGYKGSDMELQLKIKELFEKVRHRKHRTRLCLMKDHSSWRMRIPRMQDVKLNSQLRECRKCCVVAINGFLTRSSQVRKGKLVGFVSGADVCS